MSNSFDRTLVLGNNEFPLHLEEYKRTFQVKCDSWTGNENKYVEVHFTKLYNMVTMTLHGIFGDAVGILSPSPDTMNFVPYDGLAGVLPNGNPSIQLDGRIPDRFLPRIHNQSIVDGNNESFAFSYLVSGINDGSGFPNMLTLKHYPLGHANEADNGSCSIGFNSANVSFSHSDASVQCTSVHYLANSNLNIRV